MRVSSVTPPTTLPPTGSADHHRCPIRRTAVFAFSAILLLMLGAVLLLLGMLWPGVGWSESGAGPAGLPKVEANVPVTASDLITKPSNNSPQLVVDPEDSRFVALANRLDGPDFGCALQVSGDGGRSWLPANPVPKLPPHAEKCYAPEVTFGPDGTFYYLFVGLAGEGNSPVGVYLTTSTDHAQHFSTPRQLLGPEQYMARMVIDPAFGARGRIHLVWLATDVSAPFGGLPPPPNPIMAAYSDNGGVTFSAPTQVSDPERLRSVAPALSVGPNHAVHVLYYDLRDDVRDYQGLEGPRWEGRWSLVASTSTDGGKHFSHGVSVDDDLVPPERVMLIFTMPPPSLAADASGRLYAGWYDARNGDWDVFVRRSLDGGATWEGPRRVNDNPVGDGRHQYLPRLSVAPGGRLDVIFYDRRGNKENRGNDVYYTFSTDAGVSFAQNVRLSSVDFDSHIGPRYGVPSARGLNEFGGRIALVSERSRLLAAWTDTRNTGRGTPSQDIFATEVDLSTADALDWARLVGVALIVAGLSLLGEALRRRRSRARSEVSMTKAEA